MCGRTQGRKKDAKAEGKIIRREKDRKFIEQMNDLCELVGVLSGDDKGSGRHA
ncbi:hypothetical protein [Vibrio litoralis]|uniref:hypothetical protein n=1 Tax=Vibrio litoralis TaxID=335972 RepID=UPI0003FD1FC1|nr:hypothetical protein [Vibrio litoralis]